MIIEENMLKRVKKLNVPIGIINKKSNVNN